MKTRAEVARFIESTPARIAIPDKHLRNRNIGEGYKSAYHYGLCEVRQLMDFIYGGPPSTIEEEVKGIDSHTPY
jgi:hypothetical protein